MAVLSIVHNAPVSQLTSACVQATNERRGPAMLCKLQHCLTIPKLSVRGSRANAASLPKLRGVEAPPSSQFLGARVLMKKSAAAFGVRSVGRSQAGGVRAAVEQDIPITYVNNTGIDDPEFSVVVFTKNQNPSNINYKSVAWKILQAQSGADFVYPVLLEVAAIYQGGGATLKAGPFPASLGDTWAIKQATSSSTPLLNLVDSANPVDTIVVKNLKPSGFDGKPYDFHLIKDKSPLVVQSAVGSNAQAVIELTPTIYFGIVKDVQHGAIFNSLTDSQYNTPFQLLQYPGGLVITLTHNKGSGEFTFTGAAKK